MSRPAAKTATYRPPEWAVWLGISLAVIATAAALRYEPPDVIRLPWLGVALPESCTMRRTLSIPCPGCGLTRSFVLAADGRIADAFAMHPFGTVLFLLIVAQVPLRLAQGLRSGAVSPTEGPADRMLKRFSVPLVAAVLLGLFAASMVWWVLRLIM